MLLRILIFIFCFELASCGHESAGQGNYGYWDTNGSLIQGGVPSGQGYPNIEDGSTAWNQDGSNASYNFEGVAQQFDNLHLYDPSNVKAGGYGHHIPIQTYGHARRGGGRKKHTGGASSSSSRGKKIRKNDSPQEGLGYEGGQEGENVEGGEHMPLSIDPNESKQYIVEIYLKRYHQPENIENRKKDKELYGKVKFLERSRELKARKKEEMTTKELADRIADFYNNSGRVSNWMIEGKAYQNEIFEPLFDGHIMVLLHDLEDGIEKFRSWCLS
uniref:Uncharacterized protein n=1 Tax=Meloidogyne enterolobii TaxID=390850 RepID=A0A6V7ULH8_MELEN|nr:unnamed protein product [Meloidogyne enterolobii]